MGESFTKNFGERFCFFGERIERGFVADYLDQGPEVDTQTSSQGCRGIRQPTLRGVHRTAHKPPVQLHTTHTHTMGDQEPVYAPFFGVMGAASAMIFSAMGAAYGTAKSGTGIAAMSVMRPELIMKSIIPVVMAGILAI